MEVITAQQLQHTDYGRTTAHWLQHNHSTLITAQLQHIDYSTIVTAHWLQHDNYSTRITAQQLQRTDYSTTATAHGLWHNYSTLITAQQLQHTDYSATATAHGLWHNYSTLITAQLRQTYYSTTGADQVIGLDRHGWDFSGYSQISGIGFLSWSNKNGVEMYFECEVFFFLFFFSTFQDSNFNLIPPTDRAVTNISTLLQCAN